MNGITPFFFSFCIIYTKIIMSLSSTSIIKLPTIGQNFLVLLFCSQSLQQLSSLSQNPSNSKIHFALFSTSKQRRPRPSDKSPKKTSVIKKINHSTHVTVTPERPLISIFSLIRPYKRNSSDLRSQPKPRDRTTQCKRNSYHKSALR